MDEELFEFKIGTRVVSLTDGWDGNDNIYCGLKGTVVDNNEYRAFPGSNSVSVGVRWDENVNGHICNGECENGYGWYIKTDKIKRIVEECEDIIIDEEAWNNFVIANAIAENN